MPVLKNPKHERFAQALANGMSATDAYVEAGYRPDSGNATRLQQDDRIIQRVQELFDKREYVERKATEKAISKLAITKESVLGELAKIGFADIRKAVVWRGNLVREEDNPDGGDVLVVKQIVTNHVQLLDSDKIDDDTAAAIAEVKQSPTGGLSLKLHDKQAALVNLAKHLGLFIERSEVGKPGDFTRLSDDELDDRIKNEARELGLASFGEASSSGKGQAGGRGRPH